MALARIAKFDWDAILSKVQSADVKRSINVLRGKSNEITTSAGKHIKPAVAVDFAAYKSKLKFTSATVDSLEKIYNTTKLPQYSASLSALETHRRAALMEMVKSTVVAANGELELLNKQLVDAQASQFTKETTANETAARFPIVGREVEQEIKNHQWMKDI